MSEPLHSPAAISDFYESIKQGNPYNGMRYAHIQAYGADITDAHDPTCTLNTQTMTSFWPSGIPGAQERRFANVAIKASSDTEPARYDEQIMGAREQILSLQISKRAMHRWREYQEYLTLQSGIKKSPEHDADLDQICGYLRISR